MKHHLGNTNHGCLFFPQFSMWSVIWAHTVCIIHAGSARGFSELEQFSGQFSRQMV